MTYRKEHTSSGVLAIHIEDLWVEKLNRVLLSGDDIQCRLSVGLAVMYSN